MPNKQMISGHADLVAKKAPGNGIKVDRIIPTFGWRDKAPNFYT